MDLTDRIRVHMRVTELDGEPERPPLPTEVERAQATARRLVSAPLPGELLTIWAQVSLLGADGTLIYPPTETNDPFWTLGVVEANEGYPPPPGMVHVGSRDDEQVSWRASDGVIFYTDVWSNEPLEMFPSLEEFMRATLDPALEGMLATRERGAGTAPTGTGHA